MLVQHYQPLNESGLLSSPLRVTKDDFDIVHFSELRVCHLFPCHLCSSDAQGEEVLAVLLLVADLNPRPLSD